MENFIAYNPTKVHFGKNVTNNIGTYAKELGKKALIVYGQGSVVKNGYLTLVKSNLEKEGIEVLEFSGIKPNPTTFDTNRTTKFAQVNNIDFIVALGGGSVIDSAKITALCVKEDLDAWDVMTYKIAPTKALPLIAVLTVAATGTEMNMFAVLQNEETKEKIGHRNELAYPKHSFLDPQFTYTLSAEYTAYGIVDLIAHSLESFFGYGDSPLADRYVASIIKEAMHFAPLLLSDLKNYEYRANIMWQATSALNGLTYQGKLSGDWGVHSLGHILSILYDTAHGASLSIAYPAWLKFFQEKLPDRMKKLGELVFDTSDADIMIKKFEEFFVSINSPIRLQEIGLNLENKKEIIELMKKNKVSGMYHKITEAEVDAVVELMY